MTDNDFVFIADESEYKSVSGAVKAGSNINFNVKVSRRFYTYNVYIIFSGAKNVRLKMQWKDFALGYDFYGADFYAEKAGLIYYHFEIDVYGRLYYAGRGKGLKSQIDASQEFALSVYDNFTTPDWIKGGIIYQIFVDRFFRGKDTPVKPYAVMHKSLDEHPIHLPDKKGTHNYDFYGGNLSGITQKLDYISLLGVNCIVLSPVFEAFSNHKYDTGDYTKIDPMFGTTEDFEELIEKASKYGIKIIIDGVFNHTGSDSVYFNKNKSYKSIGAYNSKESPYYNWYSFNKFPDAYDCWWGVKTLPAIKKDCKEFQEFIAGQNGVLCKWLSKGVGGVRLDVADELSNAFLNKINYCCKRKNKDTLIIGEVWEDAGEKISYGQLKEYFWGKQLDSVMNYPLRTAILDYIINNDQHSLSETLKNIWDKYPQNVCHCLMNLLGTHDTARILTLASGIKLPHNKEQGLTLKLSEKLRADAIENLKAAVLILYTVYGVPCIFYGDEIATEGAEDPFNRRPFLWDNIDTDLLKWYKILGKMRKNPVFKQGGFKELYSCDGVYVFKRFTDTKSVIVAINRSEKIFSIEAKGYTDLINGKLCDIINLKAKGFIVCGKE